MTHGYNYNLIYTLCLHWWVFNRFLCLWSCVRSRANTRQSANFPLDVYSFVLFVCGCASQAFSCYFFYCYCQSYVFLLPYFHRLRSALKFCIIALCTAFPFFPTCFFASFSRYINILCWFLNCSHEDMKFFNPPRSVFLSFSSASLVSLAVIDL